ncbi:pyridoxal phosphate-dependent aminotransferase [Christiangramia flava]|uniref:Aminotransferase n=1 Tax=Christiangramia flava JLT2011 TaxID=1229726 RepID=A0A1L7I6U5_9FLAO|nr:aminotransferase class I/II-fold pyridoxal phosphate-dependent enzyme [Christiangramia flava]APU68845.1 Biosynthetic Aromatic amino acid aminotransferase alpha [Christiangramia flava JLT2011]OSS39010.1 Biosynthetic Aromatic amino acid aminotransferase alpha [Christiangramia flava JLT2011]
MITAKRLDNVQEYYFSKKLREVADLKSKGKPIINLGIGSPDLAPSPKVLEALNAGLNDPNAHQYQPYKGIPELRKAVAKFYAEYYGVDANPESEILPLMGSKEGIMHISMAFLNEGDEVLLPNPGYPTYSSVTNLVQAKTRYYDLKEELNWLPDLQELAETDLSKTKIMWVNYPHMPTGTKATKEFFKELTAFAEEHEILVVNDNPYSFIQNKEPMSILAGAERSDYVMELNSLSKSFNMAGWRVGMLLGSQKNIDSVLRVKSNMDSGMFLPLQKGAVEALNLPSSWFEEQNSVYGKRKELILELAKELKLEVADDQAGLFIWAKVPDDQSSAELVDELLYDKDIFITPGFIFGSNGEGFVRFSLCASEETIQQALKRVQS